MFYISSAFYAGGSIFFAIFADGEIQSWNYYGLKQDPEDNNNVEKQEAESKKSVSGYDTFPDKDQGGTKADESYYSSID